MANIRKYTDVRSFLRDSFNEAKTKNPRWSVRSWALKLKLPGPSGLAMVLSGRRNVGKRLADKLIRYFKLGTGDREYFLSLVRLGSSPSNATLISMLRSATTDMPDMPVADIPRDVLLAYRWYFYAVREMTLLEGFEPTVEWISPRLRHAVPPEEIRATLESLLKQSFLEKDAKDRLVPAAGKFQGSGVATAGLAVRFQNEVLDLARASLAQDEPDHRGFFSSTLSIAADDLPAAKEAIRRFRAEFERNFEKRNATTTIQLNIQLFSVADAVKPSKNS